jgi:hypothetical protein
MKKTLIAMTFFASVATSALAGPMENFNNAAVPDSWTPVLWGFGSSDHDQQQNPYAYGGFFGDFFSGDSVIRCSSHDDRSGRNQLSSIYAFYAGAGPTWTFPNTVTSCTQAGISDPIFVGQR